MRALVPVVSLAALAVLAAPARAFERTRVDTDPDKAVYWRFRVVRVSPAIDTSRDLGADAVQRAVARSIATWNAAAVGCSDLSLVDAGYPGGLTTNLERGMPDMENRIVWREDAWPPEVPAATLALTTLVYRRSSGEIVDADIDFNGVHHLFTDVDDPELAEVDVQNTLTHELGHLIGLAHVEDPEATMYSLSLPGDLAKRTLSEDDRDGLCFIYPEGRLTPAAVRRPGTELSSGCAAAAPGARPLAPLALLFTSLAIARRRRAAPRASSPGGRACASSTGARRRAGPSRAPPRSPR
ncbi:MAG: matrixin family metalloprotease [Sandaracinaceae bacterium]|nr:matrixin family metalloprotease [Sandaracinaceae bacterium]